MNQMSKSKVKTFLLLIIIVGLTAGIIDLNNLFNYENQIRPVTIIKDNSPDDNLVSDARSTLGRVLFYDKNLSIDNTTSCSSCHLQEFAFGDTAKVSIGVNGVTRRHSMRLINARFSDETHAFWDEHATSFEEQATMPIQDPIEMGFSGENGFPNFDSLIIKMESIAYYPILFEFVFGDPQITETRMQNALAQFTRSIESYDSRYDEGREQVQFSQDDFPNFSEQENFGKSLFFTIGFSGGGGCFECHKADEFSIVDNCANNGVITNANNNGIDLQNTKPPTLRDLVNPEGLMNGPFMHNGSLESLMDVLNHYNTVAPTAQNDNLDFRLLGVHSININQTKKEAIIAFLLTLTGENVYTAEQWSDPFDEENDLQIIPDESNNIESLSNNYDFQVYPNPAKLKTTFQLPNGIYQLSVYNAIVQRVHSDVIQGNHVLELSDYPSGTYILKATDLKTGKVFSNRIIIDRG